MPENDLVDSYVFQRDLNHKNYELVSYLFVPTMGLITDQQMIESKGNSKYVQELQFPTTTSTCKSRDTPTTVQSIIP